MRITKSLQRSLDNILWEISPLSTDSTGLPMVIYVSAIKTKEIEPRIFVRNKQYDDYHYKTKDLVLVTIKNEPEQMALVKGNKLLSSKDYDIVKRWIRLNKKTLIAYGNNEIDTSIFINLMKKSK